MGPAFSGRYGGPEQRRLADSRLSDQCNGSSGRQTIGEEPNLSCPPHEHGHIFGRGKKWRNCRVNAGRTGPSVVAMSKILTCACGVTLVAASADELLTRVEDHIESSHHDVIASRLLEKSNSTCTAQQEPPPGGGSDLARRAT